MLPFDWHQYFELADELVKRTQEEAALRTAVSRAYYYAYHLAVKRAQDNGFIFRQGEAKHQQLWRNYSGSPDFACRQLGELGKRLKEKREKADYEPSFVRIDELATQVVEDARNFATMLARIPARLPRPEGVRQ